MIRRITMGVLLSLMALLMAWGQPSSTPVEQALAKLNSEKGLCIEFELSMPGSTPDHGTYYALKDMFYIETSELKAWYNGKELWVYLYQNGEINLSHPEPEEIIEINPLIALPLILKEYRLTVSKTATGHLIVAVPQKKSRQSVEHIRITGNKKNPIKNIEVKEKEMTDRLSIHVKTVKQNINISKQTFSYTPDKEPNAKVIDLR